MPLIGNTTLTPAQAITKGLCPECATALAGLDPAKHAKAHWGHDLTKDLGNPEAATRRRMLMDYGKRDKAEA